MSTHSLIQTLQKSLLLHKSLNEIAKQKTEIIKKGNTEALQLLLKDEKKHIQAINKLEIERIQASKILLCENGNENDNPTISDCILVVSVTEQGQLKKLKAELQDQIKELTNRNDLNQQMLEQSLQFVNLSLDILMPNIETFNYERPGQAQPYEDGRSLFNSKA